MNPTDQPAADNPQQTTRSRPTNGLLYCSILLLCFLAVLGGIELPPPSAQADPPIPTPSPYCPNTPTPTPSATQVPYSCRPCGQTPTPTVPPDETPIPTHYQKDGHGTLAWQAYTPTPAPPPGTLPPGIVLVHGAGWHAGDSHETNGEAADLAKAGYYVVSVNYELAPCGVIPNQQCHADDDTTPGWWVQREIQDVEAFVTAFRDSGLVDPNKVGMVGGSAGASLVAYVALDTTDTQGAWPYWNASVRPVCVVMLSGAYDLSDRIPPEGLTTMDPHAILDIENFTQTNNPALQRRWSPVYYLENLSGSFVPMFLIHSDYDPTLPRHQLDDMMCSLESKGILTDLYKVLVIWYSDLHSFSYWQSCDQLPFGGGPCTEVRQDVIAYLDAYLK
jgi:acetyl esterase/lipase